MSDEEKKNIFSIVQGGATEETVEEDTAIINTYEIITHDGNAYLADGFLMPTSQHIMVMRETPQGALPVLLVPLDQVKYVSIVEDDED